MPHQSEPALLVALALRLESFAPADVVATRAGLTVEATTIMLDDLEHDGAVRYRDGRRPGWSLTAEGRKEGERLLGDEIDALGVRDVVRSGYEEFLAKNPGMLELCTDWQLRRDAGGDVPLVNEHTDLDYDRAVIVRLDDLHARSRSIWQALGEALDRFVPYDQRFEHALEQVAAGDHDWFTKPSIDSYHTVWFELHENLLATLGIERANEHVGD